MENGIDSQTAHELVDQMRGLTAEVVRLRTSFDIYGPMLDSQVNGLADVTNRQTKTEGRVDSIVKELAGHCDQQKVDEKEDRDAKRWVVAQVIVACAAVTAIVQALLGMVPHPK